MILRDIGDLDYNEIAEVLGVAIGTVKSRSRAAARSSPVSSGTATTTRNVQAQDEMADMTDDDFTLDELAAYLDDEVTADERAMVEANPTAPLAQPCGRYEPRCRPTSANSMTMYWKRRWRQRSPPTAWQPAAGHQWSAASLSSRRWILLPPAAGGVQSDLETSAGRGRRRPRSGSARSAVSPIWPPTAGTTRPARRP